MLSLVKDWLLRRLAEPSTWGGIALSLQNDFHINFNGDFKQGLINLGVAAGSLIMIFMKEGMGVKK